MSDEFQPVYCQEVVAAMVGAMVASIIDPVDEPDEPTSQFAQPFAGFSPEQERVAASLASLVTHFEERARQFQKHGMPDHLVA